MIVSTYLKDSNFFGGFYDDDKIPSNRELAGVMYENQFLKPTWNGTEWIEGATDEEIEQEQQVEALRIETEMYKKRTQDGINAYAEISAEFRLAKLAGVITEAQHGAIEETLIPVRNEVLAGQWISALQKLEAIGVAIGSELYNRLHTQISNYIAENYDLPN
jgi:hypothetical protein